MPSTFPTAPTGIPQSNFKQECPSDTQGTTCSSRCPLGYKVTGVQERTCQSNGQWTAGAAACVLHDCGALPLPAGFPSDHDPKRCQSTTFGSGEIKKKKKERERERERRWGQKEVDKKETQYKVKLKAKRS